MKYIAIALALFVLFSVAVGDMSMYMNQVDEPLFIKANCGGGCQIQTFKPASEPIFDTVSIADDIYIIS